MDTSQVRFTPSPSGLPAEQPSPESFGAFSLQLRPETLQLLLDPLAIFLTFASLAFYVGEEAFALFAQGTLGSFGDLEAGTELGSLGNPCL